MSKWLPLPPTNDSLPSETPPAYPSVSVQSADLLPNDEYVATQTTTTQVTTTTTTHFFPLFRKRLPSNAPPIADPSVESGLHLTSQTLSSLAQAQSGSYVNNVRWPGAVERSLPRIDKDLPRLPDEVNGLPANGLSDPGLVPIISSPRPPVGISSDTVETKRGFTLFRSLRNKDSTIGSALVQSSLGVGSSSIGVNLDPRSISSSSPLDGRPSTAPSPSRKIGPSVSFVSNTAQTRTTPASPVRTPTSMPTFESPEAPLPPLSVTGGSTLRRLKSFSRTADTRNQIVAPDVRRKRGLSIGPTTFNLFPFAAQASSPQKQRSSEESPRPHRVERATQEYVPLKGTSANSVPSRSRVVSDAGRSTFKRRNSLWFRKRDNDDVPPVPIVAQSPSPFPRGAIDATGHIQENNRGSRPQSSLDSAEPSVPHAPVAKLLSSPEIILPVQRVLDPLGFTSFDLEFPQSPVEMSVDTEKPSSSPSSQMSAEKNNRKNNGRPTELGSASASIAMPSMHWQDSWRSARSRPLLDHSSPNSSRTTVNDAIPSSNVVIASPLSPDKTENDQVPLHSNYINHSRNVKPTVDSNGESKGGSIPRVDVRPRRSMSAPRLSIAFNSARSRSSSVISNQEYSSPSTPIITAPSTPILHAERESTNPFRSSPLTVPISNRNVPLLRKLSQTFFSHSTFSPPSQPEAALRRSSSSFGHSPGPQLRVSKPSPPEPLGNEETPELYVERLMSAVSKAEIAGLLAAINDSFHSHALRAYISRFNFHFDPLDVALRKLLMDVGLPRETQQIDRVIEAFAARYEDCNPGLFMNADHPYILAFSLIMLHTDAFNPSNKSRMGKTDYIKNTRLPGIPPEVLDCFYDNITFAPFIFVEDPVDVNGQRGYNLEGHAASASTFGANESGAQGSILGKQRIDPYFLISRGLLDPLRADVESFVPWSNPYSSSIADTHMSEKDLHWAFAAAPEVEVLEPIRRKSLPLLGPSLPIVEPTSERRSLRITKVGVLARKEDIQDGGKKAPNRKWREWSVILTGSQLLFFKDVSVAAAFADASVDENGHHIRPLALRPDELLSLKNSVALVDGTQDKHPETFRFVLPTGRQYLVKTHATRELVEWVALINYASAFRSSGVRMRSMGMTGSEAVSTGAAAALSHVKDLARMMKKPDTTPFESSYITRWSMDEDSPEERTSEIGPSTAAVTSPNTLPASPATLSGISRGIASRMTVHGLAGDVDLEPIIVPKGDGRLEDTFNEVKAELASRPSSSLSPDLLMDKLRRDDIAPSVTPLSRELNGSHLSPPLGHDVHELVHQSSRDQDNSHRSLAIHSKIGELDSRLLTIQTALDADLRIARNFRVLTPFQKSTRDRIQQAVLPIATRVQQLRLDYTRLQCYRDILATDLTADQQEREVTKTVALKAATRELRERALSLGEDKALLVPGRANLTRLSSEDSISKSAKLSVQTAGNRRDSSTVSFYSAVDDAELTNSPSVPEPVTTSSSRDHSSQTHLPSNSTFGSPDSPRRSSPSPSPNLASPSDALSDEEAEDWHKTRAAHRVSLVTVSPDILPSARLHRIGPAHASGTLNDEQSE